MFGSAAMDAERQLLKRYVAEGDAEAFHALVQEYQHMVYAVCRRMLGNEADAEDATQACFLELARRAAKLRPPIGGWLHCVAVRVAINMRQQDRARKQRERAVAGRDEATND